MSVAAVIAPGRSDANVGHPQPLQWPQPCALDPLVVEWLPVEAGECHTPPKRSRRSTLRHDRGRGLWMSGYGVATKFWVLEVAGPVVPLPEPTANWLTCQIWFAVAGSGVAAA